MNTSGLAAIIGKTITGVVLKQSPEGKRTSITCMLHLVFSDGTSLELSTNWEDIYISEWVNHEGLAAARRYWADALTTRLVAYQDEAGEVVVES